MALLIGAAIVAGGIRGAGLSVQGSIDGLKADLQNLKQTNQQIQQRQRDFGALTGPDLPYDYLSVGGIRHHYFLKTSFGTPTTTPCAFAVPKGTSTLVSAVIRMGATTSAQVINVYKGIGPNSTSSWLFASSTHSGGAGLIFATSSITATDTNARIFETERNDNFLVFDVSQNTSSGVVRSNILSCQAEFEMLSY